ncbi:hypothetical protein LCGC14_2271430 [marine sediment metagenome]|uniref:Uncharacterized protein n=1 Tax=marine sediment metagenome TaxID=412755 RepID=A0A0F9CWV7_9ZZZZ
MMALEWQQHKTKRGMFWLLLPTTATPWGDNETARVFCLSSTHSPRRFFGSYQFFGSTGNTQSGTVVCGSALSTRRWIEKQLAQFWEPPEIINPA